MHPLKPLPLLGLLALSLVFVFLTLLIPINVMSRKGLASVEMGYPFSFLRQDFSGIDPPSFPWSVTVASPWEYPLTILWATFLLDILLVVSVLFVAAFLLKRKRVSA